MKSDKPRFIRHHKPLVILSTRDLRPLVEVAGHAIAEAARDFGWDLLDLRFTRGSLPEDRAPDGALIEWLPSDPIARRLRQMGCPAVRLGRFTHPDDDKLPAILPDLHASGRLAADHFAERGFRHVGYVGRRPFGDYRVLYEGFLERVGELKGECHLLQLALKEGEASATRHERWTREVSGWLNSLPKPVSLLTFADAQAASLCAICREAGFSVPEEVAVLGLGNSILDCEMAPVSLSSIDPATDEWGRQGALLLQRLMKKERAPKTPIMVLPRGVVVRRSTDMLAVDDPAVARAMRFMWDHLDQNLSVEDVAREIGMQRRQIERAFRRHLQRGVNAELRRKRLERCCELLRSTTTSITDLAPRLGFRSADYLHSSFRQAFGMTPRTYRMQKAAGARNPE